METSLFWGFWSRCVVREDFPVTHHSSRIMHHDFPNCTAPEVKVGYSLGVEAFRKCQDGRQGHLFVNYD